MKKTFLAFLLIFTFIYSDETLIEIEDLKPISYENGIDILLVEGQFEEAKILLDDYSKKKVTIITIQYTIPYRMDN